MLAFHKRILFLCASICFVFLGCHPKHQDVSAVQRINKDTLRLTQDAMKHVVVTKVTLSEFPDTLSLMGRISVTEDRIAVVSARVAGRVDVVYVASGERVSKDQSLASLFSADVAIAREEYLQAMKQPQNKAMLDTQDLVQMSRSKLMNIGMSEPDINILSAPSKESSTNLTIRAPRSGVLLDKKAVVGNLVNVGDTLFTIGDLSKVWFAGDIYPEDLSRVHKDQEMVVDPGTGASKIYGKISFISPVIDPTTRTIKVRALMNNPGGSLRADMYVKGDLTLSKSTALIIPAAAMIRLQDMTFCFKQISQTDFQKIPLELTKEQGGLAAIKSGLKEGEGVVSGGALLLDAALSNQEND